MRLSHKIEYYFFLGFVNLFRIIGLKKTRQSAYLFALLLNYLVGLRKKVVMENLSIAFPEKSEAEIKRLTFETYRNNLITFFELMALPSLHPAEVDANIKIDNLDHIKGRIGTEKPAIFITGHFGGWEMCMSSLSNKVNRQFFLLTKPQSNHLISDWVNRSRCTFGNQVILSGISVRRLYEEIKKGGLVGIAGDQRGDYDSPRFNFFGRPTALYTGMATISLRTNCPVIMVAFERQPDFSYRMYMEELSMEGLPEANDDKIVLLTQRYISFLEKHIKNNPAQYFWLHKIWKY